MRQYLLENIVKIDCKLISLSMGIVQNKTKRPNAVKERKKSSSNRDKKKDERRRNDCFITIGNRRVNK